MREGELLIFDANTNKYLSLKFCNWFNKILQNYSLKSKEKEIGKLIFGA